MALLGAIGSALLGGVGGLLGGNKQADAQRYAADQAAASSRLGFDYLRSSPVAGYQQPGANANNAIANLLGVGGGGGGQVAAAQPDQAATFAKLKEGLSAWDAAKPGNAGGILQLINNGSSLQDVQGALARLRQTTTNSANTRFLDPLIQQANNPIMGQAQAAAPAAANDAFQNYQDSTGHQFQLGEGMRAITESNAAKGLLNSGATLKGLTRFGQNLGATTFNNYLNQLGGAAGRGLQAAGLVGGAGSSAGIAGGNAILQGYGNAAQAQGQGIADLASGAGQIFGAVSRKYGF
jgi:hypothetical protein